MMLSKQLGKAPEGERLKRIQRSPHYKRGAFQNIHATPNLTKGYSMAGVMYNFLFKKHPHTRPECPLPANRVELKQLPLQDNLLVWFGHSSYYIQLNGQRFLIDPVFSGNAAPIACSNKAFKSDNTYTVDDMPQIDYLLITHDHYDHLDYPTVLRLRPYIKNIICGLGVGQHFEYWGFNPAIIKEKDWNETEALQGDIHLYTAPTRHFSGRAFKRNNTLWLSFILETTDFRMYLGGDSGYGPHFKEIGRQFGGFDLAILDNGQYNLAWQAIHMLPTEGLQAAKDLNAKRVLPVHNSKFKLSVHPWDEPLKTITALNDQQKEPSKLITPKIGEIVYLDNPEQVFSRWWENIQ